MVSMLTQFGRAGKWGAHSKLTPLRARDPTKFHTFSPHPTPPQSHSKIQKFPDPTPAPPHSHPIQKFLTPTPLPLVTISLSLIRVFSLCPPPPPAAKAPQWHKAQTIFPCRSIFLCRSLCSWLVTLYSIRNKYLIGTMHKHCGTSFCRQKFLPVNMISCTTLKHAILHSTNNL